MTSEDRTKALTVIEQFESSGSGAWRRRTANRLRRTLEKHPEDFWQTYFETVNTPSEDAVVLVRTGKVDASTNFEQFAKMMGKGWNGQ